MKSARIKYKMSRLGAELQWYVRCCLAQPRFHYPHYKTRAFVFEVEILQFWSFRRGKYARLNYMACNGVVQSILFARTAAT